MAVKNKAQVHMEDKLVTNSEVLALLEEREQLKDAAKVFRARDKATKQALMKLDDSPPYRIGRFIITRVERPPRTVNFEADASVSIKITTVT